MDPLELLNHVDTFYNNAWGKLVVVVSIITGFFGVALPIIFLLFQRKSFKDEKEEIKKKILDDLSSEISTKLDLAKKELAETLNSHLDDEISKSKEKIDKEISKLNCGIYIVESNDMNRRSDFAKAIKFGSKSIGCAIKSGNQRLVQNCVNNVIEYAKNALGVSDFQITQEIIDELKEKCKMLKQNNIDDCYLNFEQGLSDITLKLTEKL